MTDRRYVLDAGALIAYERRSLAVRAVLELASREAVEVHTSTGVIAQVWSGAPRQARLAGLLKSGLVKEHPLTSAAARLVGRLTTETGVTDIVDGHVALMTIQREAVVVTSDRHDLEALGVAPARIRAL